MKKRFLASLLAFAMLLSLLPASALAAGEEDGPVYGFYDDNGNWTADPTVSEGTYTDPATGVQLSKTAVPVEGELNTYEITLQVVTSTTTTTVAPSAAATVLVIDVSGSMGYCAECGENRHVRGDWNHAACPYYLSSGSREVKTEQTRLYAAKQAAISFLDAYRGDTEGTGRYVAVVSFSSSATTVQGWTDVSTAAGYSAAEGAINGLRANGGTNLDDGLESAAELLNSDPAASISMDQKNVIALTDGQPTYSTYVDQRGREQRRGNGQYCTQDILDDTEATATSLKNDAKLYTVCFGVADEECYRWGPTVGAFLRDSVASPDCAYNADNTEELNKAFEAITETIVGGIGAGGLTVTDNMGGGVEPKLPAGVDLVDGSFTWDLENPEVEVVGDTTYYTYTLTYRVTLDPTAIEGFDENGYYPLNGETTLNIPGYNPIQFPVPAVQGVLPVCTVTYEPGTNGTLAGADADGNVVHENVKYGTATPAAPAVTAEAGWYFTGWAPDVAATVTGEATYVAQYAAQGIVTVTANGDTVTYDGTEHSAGDLTVKGLPAGYTIDYSASGASGTDAGTYISTIVGTGRILDENGNDVTERFSVSTANGTLTINPRQVTLTSATDSKEYDGTPLERPDVTVGGDGFVEGEVSDIRATGSVTYAGEVASNTIVYTENAGFLASNYVITKYEGRLSITNRTAKYEVEVKANSGEYTYDGTVKTVEGFVTLEVQAENGLTYTVEGLTASGSGTDANTYTVGVSGTVVVKDAAGRDVTDQFNVTAVPGQLVINKRQVTLTSATDSKEYDGTPLTNGNVTVGGQGFAEGEGVTCTVTGSQTLVGSSENHFTYVWNAGTNPANYAITEKVGTLTVTNRNTLYEITVVANSDTVTYDGTEHSAGGLEKTTFTVNGNEYTVEGLSASASGTNAGEYTVNVTGTPVVLDINGNDVTDQFSVTTVSGKLTIEKRQVTLTSATDSKMYDGTPLTNDNVTVGGQGFAEGEGATYTVTGTRTLPGSAENYFTYALSAGTNLDNYEIACEFGTLTVTDRIGDQRYEITVTANSGTEKYDGAEKTVEGFTKELSYSFEVVKADGTSETVTYTVSGLSASVTGTDAGEYTVNVTGTPVVLDINGNDVTDQFIVKTVDGKLTINKRQVTLTSATDSKEYDGYALTNGTVEVSGDRFAEGEGATYNVTGSQTLPGSSKNTFTYTLNEGTKAENYEIKMVEGDLTVRNRDALYEITVVAKSGTEKYDGTLKTVSGLEQTTFTVDGHDYTVEGLSASASGINAGEYTADVIGDAVVKDAAGHDVTDQFNVKRQSGTLTIEKRTVTLTSGDASKEYDGTALTNDTVTVGGDGWADGEGATYNVTGSQTLVGLSENTFTYALNEGTSADNYDIAVYYGTLTVTTRNAKYTIEVVANSGTEKYDGSEKTVTGFETETFVAENGLTYTVSGISAEGKGTDAGEYVVNVVGTATAVVWDADGNNVTSEFAVTFRSGKLTINPRQVTLTSESASKEYDGTPLERPDVTVGGDGFVDGEADAKATGSVTNVGSAPNTIVITTGPNYKGTNYSIQKEEGTLTVTKNGNENGDVQLVAEGYTGTYDGLGHDGVTSQNVTGAVEGNAWTYLYSTDGETYSSEMPQFTDAGSYTVYVKAVCDNYTDLFTSVTVTITPAPLTVVTPDAEKTYDGTPLTAEGRIEGFVNGETATFRTTGTQTDAGSSRNSYELIWDGTAKESNYTVSATVGTLTVNRAKVTITVDDKTKTYGEDDPAFTGTVAGLIGSDDLHVVYTRAAGQENAEDVGSVTLTANYTENSNYEVTIVPGTLTILPKAVTVTANDAGKTYGTADPEFTAVVAGLIEGESEDLIHYTLSREAGENVGEYAITPAGETLQGNYTVTYIAGVFTISPAEVTITVDSKSKIYGEDDPAFTGTVVGVIDGDDLHVVYARADADAKKENVGDDITITASYDANSNYTVTVIPGKLTILPADGNAVNVTSYAGKYDGESHSVAAEALKEGSTLHYSTDGTAWSETLPTFTDVGEYTVYVYATNPNYKDTETVSGTVIITKRAVTLTSATDSKVYDGTALTNGTVTVGGDGFVKDEGADYDVTGSQTKIGSSENTFTYSLKDNTKAGNYDITTVNGTLTVTAASNVTVTKTAETNSVTLGGAITWKVTVTNNGDADAKDLCLTDSIQGVTITGPEGVDYRCFDLKAGESITFTVTYKPTETGVYVNHVEVSQPKDGGDGDEREKIDEDDSDPVYVTPYYPPYRPTPVNKPTLNTEDHVAYIIGYEDGTVKPEGTITRAEVATIFFRLLTDESREEFWSQVNPYLDVAETAWYNNAVSTLHAAGIIVDSETGFFRPDEAITRAELAVMAAQFTGLTTNKTASFTDVPLNHWAAGEIALVEQQGWINGYEDGTFRPDATITRAETMAIINRMLKRAVDEDHMLRNMVKWIDNPVTAWYYEDVQEATNSHSYVRLTQKVAGQGYCYEDWQEILAVPDWAALENLWATANSK